LGENLRSRHARAEELVFAVLCPFANQFCVPKAKDRLECEIREKKKRRINGNQTITKDE
jgi:hypothetical protein